MSEGAGVDPQFFHLYQVNVELITRFINLYLYLVRVMGILDQ